MPQKKPLVLAEPVKAPDRFGHIDAVDEGGIQGWAVDLTISEPASLILVLDEQIAGAFTCSIDRPDVIVRSQPGGQLGFRIDVPEWIVDGRAHRLQVRFRTGETLTHVMQGVAQEHVNLCLNPSTVQGQVDGLWGTSIRGWAFRSRWADNRRVGGVTIEVRAGGVRIGETKADLVRNDVAAAHGCAAHCGFLYTVPHRFRDGRRFELEFLTVPEGIALLGSPLTGSVIVRDNQDRLVEMYSRMERLCTEVYALKDQLRQLVAADEYVLGNYNAWAVSYYPTLLARVIAERGSEPYRRLFAAASPMVSVICPVFRPVLADFVAAVDSVRRQSWANWELIIVDDGSDSAELTKTIESFCHLDSRIRAMPVAENGGISRATNVGIAAASGTWLALFDHDDLLVEVALEVMLMAALDTGAKLLYSDEDKIDEAGLFSMPHLKTDWNYRLLLGNNYVCHLLLIDTQVMRQVGPLRPVYDGAQDYDLVLRLSELLPASAIHHVPELLYHWRKSPGSTASAQSAKPYAVEAGRLAVSDHLRRRHLPASVRTRFQSTLYDVRWAFRDEPKVSILIPFKDQVEMTRRCVACVLENTEYGNYEVVLIDNWSSAPETRAWLNEIGQNDRVKIVRIEEGFNFSRLNNLAAQQLETEYFLFLNNDVFHQQPDWIRLMVDECLADPAVGIVGVKLLYPNQTIQHAGVTLGVGGVADHAFRYASRDEWGYCFRAACTQEMSAVTGACLLCRADVFRAVGMFDEEHLTVAFNDVDLCLKVSQAGYRVVMTTAVVAEHHESISRGSDYAGHNLARFYEENQCMLDRWSEVIRCDPFYNPHFSREAGMFEKLSSASLSVKTARSLLAKPVRRADPPRDLRVMEPGAVEPALADAGSPKPPDDQRSGVSESPREIRRSAR